MKHFLTFIKRKGLHIEKGNSNNPELVHQINHELMNNGYVLSKDLFDRLSTQSPETLKEVLNDLIGGINRVVGGDGYVATYQGFPQSVLALSYKEFVINATFVLCAILIGIVSNSLKPYTIIFGIGLFLSLVTGLALIIYFSIPVETRLKL